jgi:acetyl-CoA C-acetyltransferase
MQPSSLDDAVDPRTPVIAGVGTATQHLDEPGAGVEALELMVAAAQAAGDDSGGGAEVLRAVERVAVPGGSWKYRDPGRLIAERIGAADAHTVLVPPGTPQQTLLNDALRSVREGELDVALVVGGEAGRRAVLARRAGVEIADTVQDEGVEPDEFRPPTREIITKLEIAGGFQSAQAPFAIIDSAVRGAEGKSLDQHRDEVAELWAGFNRVARDFPEAAFPEPRDAAWIREPSTDNRPMAFPYNKWHCAQMHVDQAAAILICSLDAAARLGVSRDRVVFPIVALESSYSVPVSARADIHRWTGMEVLGSAAEAHLGFPLRELAHAELYSCFPAAVRVQQRALGLPVDGVPTITGGETFAGGPWNNFVLQATAAMIDRVRAEPGEMGLVSTVSGLLNKPGLAVYSTHPGPELLLDDLADENERAADRKEVVGGYEGPAQVVAYTVHYEGMDPVRVTMVADTPEGQRCVASAPDPELAARVTREELIGTTVQVTGTTFSA